MPRRGGARALRQQVGVTSGPADATARAAGLDAMTDRCLMVGHARWAAGGGTTRT
jgi:predicted CoA-binding protein